MSDQDGNVVTLGVFDVDDPAFARALDEAERATERATLERQERAEEPGFFVVPKGLLPPL